MLDVNLRRQIDIGKWIDVSTKYIYMVGYQTVIFVYVYIYVYLIISIYRQTETQAETKT